MNDTATLLARDALKELVSIGSGNALTSLNRMIGRGSISLSLPQYLERDDAVALDGLQEEGIGVSLTCQGKTDCTFLAVFDDASARQLAGLLLERGEAVAELGTLEESALLEAVNIISCSFLGAIGSMVHGVLVPSPPVAHYGRLADIVREQAGRADIVLTTAFDDPADGFSGRILVLTEDQAARAILTAVGVAA